MLATGGEALQLTNDETDKFVTNFSADGTEIYYRRVFGKDESWSVPTLGGSSKRVVDGYAVAPSPDGKNLYYTKAGTKAIYRADRTGMGEELVFALDPKSLPISRIMPFPDGKRFLVLTASGISTVEGVQLYVVDLEKKSAEDLIVIQGNPSDVVWQEPGKKHSAQPHHEWSDQHLEADSRGQISNSNHLRPGTRPFANARSGWQRPLSGQRKIHRIPHRLQHPH